MQARGHRWDPGPEVAKLPGSRLQTGAQLLCEGVEGCVQGSGEAGSVWVTGRSGAGAWVHVLRQPGAWPPPDAKP